MYKCNVQTQLCKTICDNEAISTIIGLRVLRNSETGGGQAVNDAVVVLGDGGTPHSHY